MKRFEYHTETISRKNLKQRLNELGGDGWELRAVWGFLHYFIRNAREGK